MEPTYWLRFIQSNSFAKDWADHGLTDDDLRTLELVILTGPDHWPIIKGTGGLRKLRFADPRANRGKSGSYRVCYVFFEPFGSVWLATLFGKNEKANLSAGDKKAIAQVIGEIEAALKGGMLR